MHALGTWKDEAHRMISDRIKKKIPTEMKTQIVGGPLE